MEKYNTIYWTPCAAHCLNLLQHDLAKFPWINETIRKAKTVVNFIINRFLKLSLQRKNATKELLRLEIQCLPHFTLCWKELLKVSYTNLVPSLAATLKLDDDDDYLLCFPRTFQMYDLDGWILSFLEYGLRIGPNNSLHSWKVFCFTNPLTMKTWPI